MLVLKLIKERTPKHYHIRLFVGRDKEHMQMAGVISMEHDQALAFERVIKEGVDVLNRQGFQVVAGKSINMAYFTSEERNAAKSGE